MDQSFPSSSYSSSSFRRPLHVSKARNHHRHPSSSLNPHHTSPNTATSVTASFPGAGTHPYPQALTFIPPQDSLFLQHPVMDQPSSSDSFYAKSCFFFPSLLGGGPTYPFLQNEEDENYPIITDSSSALLLGSLHDQAPAFSSPISVRHDAGNLVPHNSGTQFLPCAWADEDGMAPDFTAALSTSDANVQKRLALTHNNTGSVSGENFHLPPPVPVVNGLGRLPFFNFNHDKLECGTNMDEEEVIKVLDLEDESPPVENYFQGEDGNQGLEFANKDASNANSCSVITGDHDRGKKAGKLPAKNLMAERRRRKKLNDRLYMLRSVIPKISKVQNTPLFPPSFISPLYILKIK